MSRSRCNGLCSGSDHEFAFDDIAKNCQITILNPFRENKKLLILDVDYTLTYRDKSPRYHLHEMLTRVYRDYDIALWSSVTKDAMFAKLQGLNLFDSDDFKFAFSVTKIVIMPGSDNTHNVKVKPLFLIWSKFTQFSAENTILFDDNSMNYALNKTSGISSKKSPYWDDNVYDKSLLDVAAYLRKISIEPNFETIDHNKWMATVEPVAHSLFSEARIVGEDIPIGAFAIHAKVDIQLTKEPIPLLPLHPNAYGDRMMKFKVETKLPTANSQVDFSEIMTDLESADIYFIQLDEKISGFEIELVNPFRDNKKLLVLDLDYTLCDPDICGFPCLEARRPYINEFLSRVYQHYDIAIWCAKNKKWITNTMMELKIMNNSNYKIAFCLTAQVMITVNSKKFGFLDVKPLEIIWGQFPRYYPGNTITVDDIEWNFMMNPQSGLEIKPYKVENETIDNELRRLARYLETIASVEDFRWLNHKNWRCIDKVIKIDDNETCDSTDSLIVNVEWPGSKIELVNVHKDLTIGNLKTLIDNAIGIPVEDQNLRITSYVAQSHTLQPYLKKKLIVFKELCKTESFLSSRNGETSLDQAGDQNSNTQIEVDADVANSNIQLNMDSQPSGFIRVRSVGQINAIDQNSNDPMSRRDETSEEVRKHLSDLIGLVDVEQGAQFPVHDMEINEYPSGSGNREHIDELQTAHDHKLCSLTRTRLVVFPCRDDEFPSQEGSPRKQKAAILQDYTKMYIVSSTNFRIELQLLSSVSVPDLPMAPDTNERCLTRDMISFVPANQDVAKPIRTIKLANPEIYNALIEDRVQSYEVTMWNPLRDNHKLLILDLDYTIYDPDVSSVSSARRPFLRNLLSKAYRFYNIVIWSERSKKSTKEVLEALDMMNNRSFKIAFALTAQAMVDVGSQYGSLEVKPLEVIWRKFPQFSAKNTIIVDDNDGNFKMNYQSGYKISPYSVKDELTDTKLKTLASYLDLIVQIDDFRELQHESWRLPGKILMIMDDGEIEQQDDRVNVVIRWVDNRLTFENIHVDTVVGEIKSLIRNVIGLPAENQDLIYRILDDASQK